MLNVLIHTFIFGDDIDMRHSRCHFSVRRLGLCCVLCRDYFGMDLVVLQVSGLV